MKLHPNAPNMIIPGITPIPSSKLFSLGNSSSKGASSNNLTKMLVGMLNSKNIG